MALAQKVSREEGFLPVVPPTLVRPATMAGAAGFYFVQRRRSALRAEAPVEGGRDR